MRALQRERGSSLYDEPRKSTSSFERFLPGRLWNYLAPQKFRDGNAVAALFFR